MVLYLSEKVGMCMKISTKGRYALRLMLDVALHSHGAAVPLRDVAQRQEISDKYLEQIVTQLSRAGLVRSVRGAGGGYLLTREPEEYTVGEILRVLEGNTVREMTMEDYLFGVTAAEMPALTRSPATLLAPCLVRVNTRAFFTSSSRMRAASSLVLLPRST